MKNIKSCQKIYLLFSFVIKKFLQIYHKLMLLGYSSIFPTKYFRYWLILLLCGPILPYVQIVLEGARPNTSLILTNGVRKSPAQYPVWGQTNIRGQPANEWTKLPSEERWSMLMRNWVVFEDDGHLGAFVRGIWWTY